MFLSLAAKEAIRGINKGDGGPFGAVIVHQGKVLSLAHNTVLKENDPTRHAEINAIQKAARKLNTPFLTDCLIYSTTEPCPMCFSAIHWAQIPEIIFSTSIGDVKKLGFNELSISNRAMKKASQSRVKITQLDNDDCFNLLTTWKRLSHKKTY